MGPLGTGHSSLLCSQVLVEVTVRVSLSALFVPGRMEQKTLTVLIQRIGKLGLLLEIIGLTYS